MTIFRDGKNQQLMKLYETEFELSSNSENKSLLNYVREEVSGRWESGTLPIRFVITETGQGSHHCELALFAAPDGKSFSQFPKLFEFRQRLVENNNQFNVVLLVPTGIGARIGGDAGDATPVARLLATICDNLITHPNVVNASDINELPDNGLYVEGSVLTRLIMGTVGLQKVRSNRVLLVLDEHDDDYFTDAAINSASAARNTLGLECSVVKMRPRITMETRYSSAGRATGQVTALENLIHLLEQHRRRFDAIAISSVIQVPGSLQMQYFAEEMTNPWGGVEAMLTHAISSLFEVPSAHSPMMESREVLDWELGVVDPRKAAEAISFTFLHCILKGLHRSPKIVTDRSAMTHQGVISAEDISCIVLPDGCLGLPTLAALEQGIKVIAVRENRNLMRNDLASLPWATGQFHCVENYWEAAGVLMALKAGVSPDTVRRPVCEAEIGNTTNSDAAFAAAR